MVKNTPRTLTPMTRSNSSGAVSTIAPANPRPALQTTVVNGVARSASRSTSWTCTASVTSSRAARAVSPRSASFAHAACALRLVDVGDRDRVATVASASAIAKPMPRAAPVTRAPGCAPSAARILLPIVRQADGPGRHIGATLNDRTSNVKIRSVRYTGHRGDATGQAYQGRLVVDLAYERIRAMVEDGELEPGARSDRASWQMHSASRAQRYAKRSTGLPESSSSSSRPIAGSSSRRSASTRS